MKLKRLIMTAVLAAVTCTSMWATFVIVDGTNVRLRVGPSTQASIYLNDRGKPMYPSKGERMEYLGTEGNFYKVRYAKTELYISRDYTHLSDETPAPPQKVKADVEKKVLGTHLLSLQWISWEYFGKVKITKAGDNQYRCVGEQKSKEHPGDFLKLDGYISIIDGLHLQLIGTITTKIYHLNNGEEYVRNGKFDFKSTQGRQYWRMQQMDGPDGVTDYVDIYMKHSK